MELPVVIVLVLLQALFMTFIAAGAAAIVVGSWPTPEGALGAFLLWSVVCAFLRFVFSLPPGTILLGRTEYDALFFGAFTLAIAWSQAEFVRPEGNAKITFNQMSWIFFITGIALSASDQLVSRIMIRHFG